MNLLKILGRLLIVPFWLAVLVNLAEPFAAPFAQMLDGVAAALFALHVVQLVVCHARLKTSASPTRDRLLLLLFGSFWLDRLPSGEALAHDGQHGVDDPLTIVEATVSRAVETGPESKVA